MLKIAILGCGYIGLQLAKHFSKNALVTGTTRNEVRVKEIQKYCQKTVILDSKDYDGIKHLILSNDLIIVTISPSNKEDYESALKRVALNIRKVALDTNSAKKLIYTSSLLVYGDHLGHWVDEESPLNTHLSQGAALIETERLLLSLKDLGWSVLIYRLGEIYGPNRELSKKISQYKNKLIPGNGSYYTNMIHSEDIVKAIEYGLHHELEGIYNLVDEDHPTRKDLYDRVAEQGKQEKIEWNSELSNVQYGNKRASNHKLKAKGYDFIYPHRIT